MSENKGQTYLSKEVELLELAEQVAPTLEWAKDVKDDRLVGAYQNLKAHVQPEEKLDSNLSAVAQALADKLDEQAKDPSTDSATGAELSRLAATLRNPFSSAQAIYAATMQAQVVLSRSGNENGVSGIVKQEEIARLWAAIEKDNKAINDDFEHLRQNGITFDHDKWKRHKELQEAIANKPDMEKQKELNKVDNDLLKDAEDQFAKHPHNFSEAQKADIRKNLDHARHMQEDREKELEEIRKKTSATNKQENVALPSNTNDDDELAARDAGAAKPSQHLQDLNITHNEITTPPVSKTGGGKDQAIMR